MIRVVYQGLHESMKKVCVEVFQEEVSNDRTERATPVYSIILFLVSLPKKYEDLFRLGCMDSENIALPLATKSKESVQNITSIS